ncbi:HTH_Tnp_Tc3_2 domain-containing protein [Trichonephila clavipes]|nr:HTH_Tnp_Tc3_2 domain-containing protein [Trichonephila clavipes]
MDQNDAVIRRCRQEWVDNSRFQFHDDSVRPRAAADGEDRWIVRSAVTAPDSSLSTFRRVTHLRVSTMTNPRRLIERNLRSYGPLCHLPLTRVAVELDYSGAWLDQVEIMLNEDV